RTIFSVVRGLICLVTGIGILVRAKWAMIAAVVISSAFVIWILGIYVVVAFSKVWSDLPHTIWQTIPPLAIVLPNLAVVIFFVRSWLRDRRDRSRAAAASAA
ncbi:MAG: hypothetical protein WB997_08035, partial [Candidatus Acidiferrales bacterium]